MFSTSNPSSLSARSLRNIVLVACLAASASFPSFASESPSIVHSVFMRGQVLEANGEAVVICVGSNDGAVAGQELDVIRHRRVASGPKGMAQFRRTTVGKVRIDQVIDGHYAEATVVSGEATASDSVELKR